MFFAFLVVLYTSSCCFSDFMVCVLKNNFLYENCFNQKTIFYKVWHKKVSQLAQHFFCLTLQKTVFWSLPFHRAQFLEWIASFIITLLIWCHGMPYNWWWFALPLLTLIINIYYLGHYLGNKKVFSQPT